MRIRRIYTADPRKQRLAPEAPDGRMWTGVGEARIHPSVIQKHYKLQYDWDGSLLDMKRHYTNDPSYSWGDKTRRLRNERPSTQRRY